MTSLEVINDAVSSVKIVSDSDEPDTQKSHPREDIPTWKWFLTAAGIYICAILYGLDTTIAADIQVSVYETFQDLEALPWVGIAFPMGSAAVILIMGRAYGLFDVKTLMLASIFLFEIGSAVCGAAPSSSALIVGRVIAGMGGSGMYLGGLTYISMFTRGNEVAIYNALIGLCWGIGAILGPVVGGGFSVSKATWRWAFYINLPLAGIFAPVYFFIFPSQNPRPKSSLAQKLSEIDWIGSLLFVPVIVLFTIVVSFSGSMYAWNSAPIIALWTVWACSLLAFVIQQYFPLFTTPDRRIFPCHFLKSRSMVLLFIGTAAAGSANAVPLYYVPLLFQFTHGDSALDAAVRLLPYICVFVTFILLAGGLLPVLGRYNLFYMASGILVTAGAALMFTVTPDTPKTHIYGFEVLIAAGAGITMQTGYAVAAAKVSSPRDIPNAIGFINVAQIGCVAISLAISGCLFQNLGFRALETGLRGYGLSDELVRSALTGTISPLFEGGREDGLLADVMGIVVDTIGRLYGATIAAGVCLVVVGLGMRWEKLDLAVSAAA